MSLEDVRPRNLDRNIPYWDFPQKVISLSRRVYNLWYFREIVAVAKSISLPWG